MDEHGVNTLGDGAKSACRSGRTLDREEMDAALDLARAILPRDPVTRGHSLRVMDYALALARRVKLPRVVFPHLVFGSLLHDCGKGGVSDHILQKPGPLTPAQMRLMGLHSERGHAITRCVGPLETASLFIRQHHERWDGQGYPDGLREEEIHICSRIITLVDVFDALTTHRPYRKQMPVQAALGVMRSGRGSRFDPELTDTFLAMIREKMVPVSRGRTTLFRPWFTPSLVAGDASASLCHALVRSLAPCPVQLTVVGSGEEVFNQMEAGPVEMILLGESLRDMTGAECLWLSREFAPRAVRLMLCPFNRLEALVAHREQAGIYRFVVMPWQERAFRELVEEALVWRQITAAVTGA
ncbi:HD domain-containing phosphohydrolase [Desulfoluna butyratoxydans]|uniref:Hd domain n=1 Tax=Desulfoluna butyratoxydans TaxID=231438 RepID=A0A4U8YQB4_9BACT|nr:HD domain-containing phosphohydrolase [Desulfoluna butyratoxydans]VFQ45627.1 hd domain [Desulfoluna butyratoxydans]